MKRIMSGKTFCKLLRYLHVSSIHIAPPPVYNPIHKVSELMDYLESRYRRLYEPGEQLSLDETLVRMFGRIKFKVRIISKAARYGIKIYVITDAKNAFVLKVLVYTGQSTYGDQVQDEKKTVTVVKELCKPFAGSHRTVFFDRFY